MKAKSTIWLSLIFVIILFVFNLICFWGVSYRSPSFYINIGFANGSIVVFALSFLLIVRKKRYAYIKFQNVFIAGIYFIVSILMNLLFVIFKLNNVKVSIIINVILLALFLILLFYVFSINSETVAQIEYERSQREEFYTLKSKAEMLLGKGKTRAINKKIETLVDRINSCQKHHTIDISNIEQNIIEYLDKINDSLLENASEDVLDRLIKEALDLIELRDNKIIDELRRM